MRYLTPKECKALGLEPYAVYGGNVHSFLMRQPEGTQRTYIPHGDKNYLLAVAAADGLPRDPA